MPQCQGIKTNGDRCQRQDSGFINLNAPHLHFCTTHWGVYDRRVTIRARLTVIVAQQHHHVGTCHKWIGEQRWCGRQCEGDNLLCNGHGHAAKERRIARQAADQARRLQAIRNRNIVAAYQVRIPALSWRQVVDDMFLHPRQDFTLNDVYDISLDYFRNPSMIEPDFTHRWQFERYWRWNVHGRIGQPDLDNPPVIAQPPPPPPPPRPNNLAAIARDAQNVHTAAVSQQTNNGL